MENNTPNKSIAFLGFSKFVGTNASALILSFLSLSLTNLANSSSVPPNICLRIFVALSSSKNSVLIALKCFRKNLASGEPFLLKSPLNILCCSSILLIVESVDDSIVSVVLGTLGALVDLVAEDIVYSIRECFKS